MGWVHVRGHWLNLATVVFCRKLKEEGQKVTAVQVAVTVADPLGRHAANDDTGLISFVYLGADAEKIWRRFRV